MRVVVDTNVFISAAFKESSWPSIVIRWVDRFGGLLKTTATEQEVFEVLNRPRIAQHTVPSFSVRLRQIFGAAELVTIAEHICACRDPKIETAINGHADALATFNLKDMRDAGARFGFSAQRPGPLIRSMRL